MSARNDREMFHLYTYVDITSYVKPLLRARVLKSPTNRHLDELQGELH